MFKLEELKKYFFCFFYFFISTGNTYIHNTYANENFLEGNTLYNKYLKNKYQIDNLIGLEDFYEVFQNESNNPYLKEGDSFFKKLLL